jgi:hypothetical protein
LKSLQIFIFLEKLKVVERGLDSWVIAV